MNNVGDMRPYGDVRNEELPSDFAGGHTFAQEFYYFVFFGRKACTLPVPKESARRNGRAL
jgi:hypothetical protein